VFPHCLEGTTTHLRLAAHQFVTALFTSRRIIKILLLLAAVGLSVGILVGIDDDVFGTHFGTSLVTFGVTCEHFWTFECKQK